MSNLCIYDYDDECCYECSGCPMQYGQSEYEFEYDDDSYFDYESEEY